MEEGGGSAWDEDADRDGDAYAERDWDWNRDRERGRTGDGGEEGGWNEEVRRNVSREELGRKRGGRQKVDWARKEGRRKVEREEWDGEGEGEVRRGRRS
jgi:hypothetical protein